MGRVAFIIPVVIAVAVLVVALSSFDALVPQSPQTLKVFITSEPLKDDWVQPGSADREDSARDLAGCFRRSDLIRVVKNRAEADFVIQITGRGEGETGKAATVYSGNVAVTKALDGKYVEATIHVSDKEFRFVGSTKRRSWVDAAIDLPRDIERWAKDNRGRILSTRTVGR